MHYLSNTNRLFPKIRYLTFYVVWSLLCFTSYALPIFLPGEDAIGANGIVFTVNDVTRKPYTEGLGGRQLDVVEIQVTIVNTGTNPFQINPLEDFSLELLAPYSAVRAEKPECLGTPFTVNPGAQSRGMLCFRVESSDTETPKLRLMHDGEAMFTIVCDMELAAFKERAATSFPEVEGAVKLIKFMIDAERFDIAQNLVEKGLQVYPNDRRIILAAAMLRRKMGDETGATELIERIGDGHNLAREDALELADLAFELGQYATAQKVLEPYAEAGALDAKNLLFLARCWYFDKQYERAEKLLTDLHARGFRDRLLYFTLGNIREKMEDWRSALRWWEKALEIDPSYYEAEFNIGVALFRLDDIPGALQRWRRVLTMNPDPETRQAAEDAIHSLE